MSTLFISHSSHDSAAAKELGGRLQQHGHRSVFLDFDPDQGIVAGASWEQTLYTKLRACQAVLALCTDNYLDSHWCFAEAALARMEGKAIFTLQLDPWSETTQMPSILTEGQIIDLRSDPEEGYQRLWRGFRAKGIVPAEEREWEPNAAPYPGLRSFEKRDAPIFFGRDKEIAEGVELLNRVKRQGQPRLVMLLGASGSGKSSLARAGIVPQLERETGQWIPVGPFRPGDRPLTEFAAALSRTLARLGETLSWEEIHQRLLDAPPNDPGGALVKMASDLELRHDLSGASIVLVVDQFEELLGHEREGDDHAANRFLSVLRGSLEAEGSSLMALGTMRSDYLDAFQRSSALRDLAFKSFSVGPMSTAGRRQVIVEPAKLSPVIELEEGLAERLLDDMGNSGSLPLLAFTLRVMWDRYRDSGVLSIRDYEHLGGLHGAVAQVADETLGDDLAPEEERLLRDAFLRLVRPAQEGSGWRRKAASWEEFDDRVRPMLQRFVDSSLLVTLEDGSVELAHDALLHSWDRLRGWLNANADALHLLQEIQKDAESWRQAETEQEKEPYLWRGGRLARALELRTSGVLSLKELESSFIEAAERAERAIREQEEERQRRELEQARRLVRERSRSARLYRNGLIGVVTLLVAAAGMASYAWVKRQQARENLAASLLEQGHSEIDRGSLAKAVVYLSESCSIECESAPLRMLIATNLRRLSPVRLEKHERALTAAAFDSGGRLVVTASLDGTARIWDAASGDELQVLPHEGQVTGAAFDPAGERVVTLSIDTDARIWHAGSGVRLALLKGHGDRLATAAFDPAGERIVTASADGSAKIWDAAKGSELLSLEGHEGGVTAAAFDPEGRRVVTSARDGTARIWDAESGAQRLVLEGHRGLVTSASFDPSGSRVVTTSDDNTARIWNAETGDSVELKAHSNEVLSAAFDRDGRRVVTASRDTSARIWDAESGAELLVLVGHGNEVVSAAFDGRGLRVITASADGTARFWDAASGRVLSILEGHRGRVRAASFDSQGGRVVTASDDHTARIWDAGTPVATLAGHTRSINTAAFDGAGDRVVTAGDDNTARIWSVETGEELLALEGHQRRVNSAVFDAAGSRVVTAGDDKTARIWDAATGEQLYALEGHERNVNFAVFDTAGERVLTASDDDTARVWDASSGTAVATLEGHGDAVSSAVFDGAGKRIVTASEDGTARVWSAESWELLHTLGHEGWVTAAVFDPSGRLVLTASRDGTARIWDASSGAELHALKGHDGWVVAAVFDPQGRHVITAGRDNAARIWTVETGALRATLEGHSDALTFAAFDAQGERVITASRDQTVRLWDAHSGAWLITLEGHSDYVTQTRFGAAGTRAVTAGRDGIARIWDVSTDDRPAEEIAAEVREKVPYRLANGRLRRIDIE